MSSAFQNDAFQGDAFQIGKAGAAADMPRQGRMTDVVPAKPRHQTQTWIHSIILPILASTLVASMPFTQAQASIGPQAEPPTYRHASSVRLPAAPVETKPPQALDWRVPAIPAVIPASVEGFPLFYRQAIGKPFAQTDWPVTRLAPLTRTLDYPRLPAAPVESQPFKQLDWPVPQIPLEPPAPVSGLNLPLLSFVPPVERPFVQTEWPLPQPAPPFKSLEYPRLPAAPIESQPFKQLDWPVPQIPFEPPAPTGSLNLPLYSFVQVDKPFVQSEWPLPAFPPRYDHPVTDQAVPVFAREVIVVPRPFVQTAWPLPAYPPRYVPPVGPWMIVTLTSPPGVGTLRIVTVRGNHPSGFDDYEESWFG